MEFVEGSEGSVSEIDKVTSILRKESSFFMGIQRLTDALDLLNCFLESADAKSVEEVLRESVKSWLEETEAVEEAERYLEEDSLHKFSQALQQRRVINFLGRAGRRLSRLSVGRNINSEVPSSDASPVGVDEYGLIRDEEATPRTCIVQQNNGKCFYSFAEEYFDSIAKDVMAWLAEEAPTRSVVSLVGPHGIGKTTLAKKIYNSKIVRNHFDYCCWIDVSEMYQLKEVLKVMMEQSDREGQHGEMLHGMRTIELFGALRKFLQQKRYMFVFDDVCHEEFWHVIKQGLPDNQKGSRIIIATSSNTIADSCKVGSFDRVHKLGPLSDEMSWELFCRTAFQDGPEWFCPIELEHFSQEIIRICKGFPLPIVAIAGLLSTKGNLVSECEKLLNNFTIEFKFTLHHRPPGVLDVFSLSIHDLPNHLRSCFLYFSIFPKDALIPKYKILKLWITEGFVEVKKGKTLEELAEQYLNELVQRNMIQTCQGFYGLEKFFYVHSLIHNMVRVKACELNFCVIWDDNVSSYIKDSPRLSIYNLNSSLATITGSYVRSVFLFDVDIVPNSFLVSLIERCEFLTLLDLEYIPIDDLPEVVGNLVSLKYLCLKNTRVSRLPKSMHKLRNLETLDVRNTLLKELPAEVNNLKYLQNLLASAYDNRTIGDSTRGVRMRGGIRSLENLQTLMTVEAHHSGIEVLKELVKLQHLRKLGISGLSTEFSSALCTTIGDLSCLECLTLQAINKNEILNVQDISPMLSFIQYLVLKGVLQKLPSWIGGLQFLRTLCLSLSKLTVDPLIHLSHLPNLVSLWLYRAYEGEQLYFKEGSFQRLKLLVLRDLQGLNVVEIEEGALPLLEEMRLGSSPLLNEVPQGIRHLRNLKVLANYDMPNEFVLSMQPDKGSDYGEVKHIPTILFWYRVYRRTYKMYKLGDSDLVDHLQGLETFGEIVSPYQLEYELSFCESDDEEEEEEDDDVGRLSRLSSLSLAPRKNTKQWSFSSGFYTDDLEE